MRRITHTSNRPSSVTASGAIMNPPPIEGPIATSIIITRPSSLCSGANTSSSGGSKLTKVRKTDAR